MYNNIVRWVAVIALLGLVIVLTGCIQPITEVDQTKTAVATYGFIATPPLAPQVATAPATIAVGPGPVVVNTPSPQGDALVVQFISSQGNTPNGLAVWYDQPRGPDYLKGFSFTGSAGTPCVGYMVTTFNGSAWQISDSRALVCAPQPAVDALAANTFFLTSDGQPHTVVFGRVQNPAVSAVRVTFDDGNSQTTTVMAGGFLIVKPGVASPTRVEGLDAGGAILLPNILPQPV